MKKVEIYENYVENGDGLLLYFDERLNRDYCAPNNSVCRAVEEAIRIMDKHNFYYCDVVDKETGEVLACIYVSSNDNH